jgi:Family of unknown function (DUF5996)
LPIGDHEGHLHLYCQIVGKIRLATTPPRNHRWNAPLYAEVRGLTTTRLGSLAILSYDAVGIAPDPRRTLLAFLEAAYEAGALLAAWDHPQLRIEMVLPQPSRTTFRPPRHTTSAPTSRPDSRSGGVPATRRAGGIAADIRTFD